VHSAADSVARFEHDTADAVAQKIASCCEARATCTNDDGIKHKRDIFPALSIALANGFLGYFVATVTTA
jgi:hypothetical protein